MDINFRFLHERPDNQERGSPNYRAAQMSIIPAAIRVLEERY